MTTDRTPESSAAAPLLDLQALVVAVRRRRRIWCATALLGLLAGAAVAVLMPPPPTAVTTVLVAHEGDQPSDPGTLIRTDAALLQTTRIADRALRDLGSPESPRDFMRDYRGTGLTNNLLRIEVTGDSDTEAVARAEALADAFVADHVRRIRQAADAEAEALLGRRDELRDELARINEEIGDGPSADGPEASANLESLFARRAELTSRITDFAQRAEEASLGTPRLVAGTQVVDAARAVDHSLPRTAATNAGIGFVLGLALGLALAAVGAVVADRPVLRREIAANLGASVLAELPRRTVRPWRRRRVRAARTRLTASLARTVRGSAEPVSLLELGCARAASAIALDLAGALAATEPVAVVDGLPGAQLARRRPKPGDPAVIGGADTLAGPARDHRTTPHPETPDTHIATPPGPRPQPADPAMADRADTLAGPARDHRTTPDPETPETRVDTPLRRPKPGNPGVVESPSGRRIGVGSVAPGTAWTDLRYLGTRTVLVVRAGHGSAAWLHTVARQLADQRIAVIGVVLIDPDPRDRTDGTLWEVPHTAPRGRSERSARINGTERTPVRTARVADVEQEAR